MAHRKEEYDTGDHEVTIQQVNEGGDISAWIDGWAAYTDYAIDRITGEPKEIEAKLSEKIQNHIENDEKWEAMKTTLSWMCQLDIYFCRKCGKFYDSDNVVSTGFAGHKCKRCDLGDKHCSDNPNGDNHEDECLNPRQKNNARVATKYRCVHCGRKRETVPTG